jgi:hypothetical protein
MLIQVVHFHPLVESFDHALFRTIVATLKQNGRRQGNGSGCDKGGTAQPNRPHHQKA